MTTFMQSMGDNMNKVCQTIGCAQKRAPPKLGQNGQQNLSRGPADPIDTSDEALEQSEALINLIETAISRRKDKLKELGVEGGPTGASAADMAKLLESSDVDKAVGVPKATNDAPTSGAPTSGAPSSSASPPPTATEAPTGAAGGLLGAVGAMGAAVGAVGGAVGAAVGDVGAAVGAAAGLPPAAPSKDKVAPPAGMPPAAAEAAAAAAAAAAAVPAPVPAPAAASGGADGGECTLRARPAMSCSAYPPPLARSLCARACVSEPRPPGLRLADEYEYYDEEGKGDEKGEYEYSYTYTYREGGTQSSEPPSQPTENGENAVVDGLSPDEYEYYYEDVPEDEKKEKKK